MARGSRKDARSSRRRDVPAQSIHPFDPEAILATLKRHKIDFVVIGAYAAVTQGWSEPTSDIDITPSRDVGNLQRLATGLRDVIPRLEALLRRRRGEKA